MISKGSYVGICDVAEAQQDFRKYIESSQAKYLDGIVKNAGGMHEALHMLSKAYKDESSYDNHVLRKRIVKLTKDMTPQPAVPEEARRFLVRGLTAFENAKEEKDFEKAASEFWKASLEAPWWPDAYYNAARSFESGGNVKIAIEYYMIYLQVAPSAQDAVATQDHIYRLEYQLEQNSK